MGARAKRDARRLQDQVIDIEQEQLFYQGPRNKPRSKPIQARTEAQGHYILTIESNALTFCIGPAGTGKTYIPTAIACDRLNQRDIEKIIIVRPTVEAGRSLGFLPGTLKEKYDPYLQPFYQVFYERLGKSQTEAIMKSGAIEVSPMAYMRGTTFRDAWVLLDEAQNTTPTEMKMFLTRIGENCKVVVTGDIFQTDLDGRSGLLDAVNRLAGVRGVGIFEFEAEDIMRSGLVRDIVIAYDD